MSEFQTTMAVGNLQQSDSKDSGNRTVKYLRPIRADTSLQRGLLRRQGYVGEFTVEPRSFSEILDAGLLFQLLHQLFPLFREADVLATQCS